MNGLLNQCISSAVAAFYLASSELCLNFGRVQHFIAQFKLRSEAFCFAKSDVTLLFTCTPAMLRVAIALATSVCQSVCLSRHSLKNYRSEIDVTW